MSEPQTEEIADENFEPAPGFEYFTDLDAVAPLLIHPLRRRAYIEAVHEPVSAKDLAGRLDVPLQRMSYHVRLLADGGLLRVVRRTPRRGAVETHYRAVATFEFSDEAAAHASPETIASIHEGDLRAKVDDLLHEALRGATAEPDYFVLRAHFVVDDEGRKRLQEELRALYYRLADLERELRVPAGEGAHELNVLLANYSGKREGGRNGPANHNLPDELETIPPD